MSGPSRHAGILLTGSGAVAVSRDGEVTTHALSDAPGDGSAWTELSAVLRGVRAAEASETIAIALLPPLAELRGVLLPPLGDEEVVQLLARGGSRYFLTARGAQVVGVLARGRGESAETPRIAATAPTRLIQAIEAAARDAGYIRTHIVPVESAWASATLRFWPGRARGIVALVVADPDRTTLIEARGGQVRAVRRFRAGDREGDAIAAACRAMSTEGEIACAVVGDEAFRIPLAATLSSAGIALQPVPGEWTQFVGHPGALAAASAGTASGPMLASPATREAERHAVRRVLGLVATIAAALLVIAAGTELWGVHRELASVQAARDAVRPAVEATLVGRSTMEEAYRRLADLVASERSAPTWSTVLADMASRVPEDAYLTGFRARGDSLILDGLAANTTRVFDALTESSVLTAVRASSPVRRQAPDGIDPMERFAIGAIRRGLAPEVSP